MSDASYQGLSERARYIILGLGAVVAVLNLLAAWYFAIRTGEALPLQAADIEPYRAWLSDERLANIGAQARYDLTARAMHAISYGKLISNKQNLVLVCFGASFALSAIGFALFVIGADGAFKVSYNESKKTGVVLSGTAPGLLCFIISGWLVYEGITQRSELKLPPLMYEVSAQEVRSADPKAAPCDRKDANGTCHTATDSKKKPQRNQTAGGKPASSSAGQLAAGGSAVGSPGGGAGLATLSADEIIERMNKGDGGVATGAGMPTVKPGAAANK